MPTQPRQHLLSCTNSRATVHKKPSGTARNFRTRRANKVRRGLFFGMCRSRRASPKPHRHFLELASAHQRNPKTPLCLFLWRRLCQCLLDSPDCRHQYLNYQHFFTVLWILVCFRPYSLLGKTFLSRNCWRFRCHHLPRSRFTICQHLGWAQNCYSFPSCKLIFFR